MAIHSFLKADRSDPDWQFSPEDYFGKQFKIIDANIVELDEGVQDSVVLRQNPTEKELLAKHLKILVNKDASLEIIILNDVDPTLQQVFLYDIHLKIGSKLSLGIFAKDGKFNKHIVQIFQEEGSTFAGYGLISNEVGGDTEIITKIAQQGVGAICNQMFLGQAGEASQTVYQGIGLIESESAGSILSIESSNLITGLGGRCYSKPEIYVNAEFASTAHGAETETIDLEKICYLQSKGISEENARNMIISGFRDQVIELISRDEIKEEIREMYLD